MNNKFKPKLEQHNATKTAPATPSQTQSLKKQQQQNGNDLDHILQTRIYDSFWKLSQFNAQLRMEGTQQLVALYAEAASTKNSDYILNRLVKGLASNRKCSRLGFSCALTELFNHDVNLSFDTVLALAMKNFNFQLDDPTKPMFLNQQNQQHSATILTKEELRHMQIGLVFVYLAYVQSNRLNEQPDTVSQIVKHLNLLRKNKEIKNYVQEVYLQALCQLVKKIQSEDLFRKTILPHVEHELKEIAKSSMILNKNDLNLLLVCLNEYPSVKQLNIKFTHENYNQFYEIISQSTELLPTVQPFCVELIKYLVHTQLDVATEFWSHQIDAKLCTRKEHEKKYLSFKLFLIYLSLVTKENYELLFEKCLLGSENLIQTLCHNYCNKMSNLNKISKDIVKELAEVIRFKEKQFGEFGQTTAKLVIKFTWYARNYHELSDLFSSMIPVLNAKGLEMMFHYLTNDFPRLVNTSQEELEEEETPNKNTKLDHLVMKYIWISNQLFNMSKNCDLFKNDKLVQKILGFLLAYSYFNVKPVFTKDTSYSNLVLNETVEAIENNEKLQQSYRDTLLKYIGHMVTSQELQSKIIDFTKSTLKLIKTKEFMSGYKIEMGQQMLAKLTDYEVLTSKISKMLAQFKQKQQQQTETKTQTTNVVDTFFILTILEYFRMFDSIRNSQRIITDIELCFQEFLNSESSSTDKNNNNKKSKHKDVELNWVDVLVEMLLNLLTINKHFIRLIVKNEFKKLFPLLTFDSIKLIIDVLDIENDALEEENKGDESGEEDEGDEEEDDDDEEKEEEVIAKSKTNGHGHSKMETKEAEDSSSDEDEDDEEEEEEEEEEEKMQLDENLKFTFEKVNGLEHHSDDESFGSDLDDEAMLKMDETFAKAFKMRKQERETDSFKVDYKLRVLDLIQELFKSNTRLDLINYLIQPMLNILFESQKRPNLKSISQRILGFLVSFKHCLNKINESRLPEVDDLFATLNFIVECSTKHFNVINTLVEASMFCVKLILNVANHEADRKHLLVDKLANVYVEAIKCEKSKINPQMYKSFITRYPEHSVPLVAQIIDSTNCSEVRVHKKIFALITLSQTINNQMLIKKSEETLDLLNRKIFTFLDQILDEIIKTDDLNIKYFDACLTLTNKVLNLQKNFLQKERCETLRAKLNLFTNEAKVKQTYKSRINKLIQLCELNTRNSSSTSNFNSK